MVELGNNKGINRQGGGLSAPALTDKDREDLRWAAATVAWTGLAVSFVRSAERYGGRPGALREAGGKALIVAKIERAEAVAELDSIIEASDAVMVARGDLGVETGYAGLTGLQKRIIRMTRRHLKVSITATQMMESMITSQTPTRAEVSDVANAVMDGTDAVMLSAETAAGKYPVKAVAAMAEICVGAETYHQSASRMSRHRMDDRFKRVDEAVAMAAMYTANHLDVAGDHRADRVRFHGAVDVAYSLRYPDFRADTASRHLAPRVALSRCLPGGLRYGAYGFAAIIPGRVPGPARDAGRDAGDLVIITKGDLEGVSGGTNGMKILRVTGQ